ncbi:MAG: DUF6600 domain-containing protein [Nitrospirota bacterium]
MKKFKALLLIPMLFLFPSYSYSSDPGLMRISLLEGDAQIKFNEGDDWVPAAINTPLQDGDRLWVPEAGRTEVQLRNGTYLRLDQSTSLEVLRVEADSNQFYMNSGDAYVNFSGRNGRVIQIDTPFTSIRTYDKAKFRVNVQESGTTEVSVFRGYVYAESRSGKTRVGAGKTLSVHDDSYAEVSPLGPMDEWERWNRERDKKTSERRYGSRYLPEELESHTSDLDENGKWIYVNDYGYVWTPTVVVSVGWSPYRVGRWVWVRGDYVWISYEPWGWAPYHYGRWSFVASIGWFWVPPVRGAVHWGPGYVGWVYTPTYVAWVPLAPGEVYYGYGHYGPHSVNLHAVDAYKAGLKIVYKNIHYTNAVTVIHHDTFVTGRHSDIRLKENPFVAGTIVAGRPPIKAEKATAMPVIKEIPAPKLPPAGINDIQVKELRTSRPLVKEKASSVFTPEPPKNMPVKTIKDPKAVSERIQAEKEFAPQKQPVIKEPKPGTIRPPQGEPKQPQVIEKKGQTVTPSAPTPGKQPMPAPEKSPEYRPEGKEASPDQPLTPGGPPPPR